MEGSMLKRVAITAIAVAVMAAASVPSFAQEKKKGAAKAPSPAMSAMRERQKTCGAEWREAKAAGKVEKGMKWPKYWSACNKRLKGSAA
jgi:hypothetical protein